MSENAIQFNSVTKRNQGYLDKVSFSLPTGTIMALIGENGAGKTTIINTITGLSDIDGGEILLFGNNIAGINAEERNRIGIVFDFLPFRETFSATEVAYVLSGVYSAWDAAKFAEYMRRLHLIPTRPIKEYSQGMKYKLQLACALSHNADLLVLDEPLANLDPAAKEEVMSCLMEYMQDGNRSILISTNTPSDVEPYADSVTLIQSGKVIVSSEKDALYESYGILRCGPEDISRIDASDIVAMRRNSFGAEILVKNRRSIAERYSGMIVDKATLEEILIFHLLKNSEVI